MTETSYRPRLIERKLEAFAKHFKIVLVVGARQVGKSTLLGHYLPSVKSVVFDPIQDLYRARQDPDFFLNQMKAPLILDEIQFVPELLPALKRHVDLSDKPGQYFLTGSQNLSVLRSVSESLSGRVGILELDGMTPEEMQGRGAEEAWLGTLFDQPQSLQEILSTVCRDVEPLSHFLWRGCLPGLLEADDEIIPGYFRSYIQTYIERDVRCLEDIRGLAEFDRFLSLAGALTSQEINASKLGRDVGVSPQTGRRWLDLLLHSYQWLELFAYHGNTTKRLSGKRKGLLRDTGLACYLQRISSPDALSRSPLLGAIFETWAINYIARQCGILRVSPQLYHWRTAGGAEVDLVMERDGKLFPLEVKCKTVLTGHDMAGLRAFRETYGDKVGVATVIYAGDVCYMINNNSVAIPWNAVRRPS